MFEISISKLFNIRPAEWPRFLLLYAMIFIFAAGSTWSGATLEAAFLQQVGVEALSWFAIVKGLITIPAIAVYTAFADRVPNRPLLIAILAVGIGGIDVGMAFLALGWTYIAYPLLYLLFFIPLDDIIAAHWFTYVSGFYDTQAAKRVVPVLGTAASISGILAGLALPLMNILLSPIGIIGIWMGALAALAAIAYAMPYLLHEQPHPQSIASHPMGATGSASARPTQYHIYIDNIREGARFVLESPFLRWMMASTLCITVLLTILQYQIGQVLTNQFDSVEQIANFLALLTSIANIVLLPIQLFLLSRIIGRLGLGNANLIFPGGMLFISGVLIAVPSLFSAALAHFGRTRFYASFGYAIDNLLYNAVPLSLKGRSRAFIGGLVTPIGMLLGGLLLLLAQTTALPWIVTLLIAAVTLAYAASAFTIRSHYGRALIDMLARDDFSFLLSPDAAQLQAADPETIRELRRRLDASTSSDLTIFLARLLSEIGGSEAILPLGSIARTHAEPRVRAAMLDILAATDTRATSAQSLYVELLDDENALVRLAALSALEEFCSVDNEAYLSHVHPLLSDQEINVRARVLSAHLQSRNAQYRDAGLQMLDTMLHSHDAHQRVLAIQALGHTHEVDFVPQLLDSLNDSADEVRLEAALALETLTSRAVPKAIAPMTLDQVKRLMRDPIERVRQAALVIVGRMGGTQSYPLLLPALTDAGAQVRETAVEVLVRAGTPAIPPVLTELNAGDPFRCKMAAVVLSQINRAEFGDLLRTYIYNNLVAIYGKQGYLEAIAPYTTYSGSSVLRSTLIEQSDQLRDEIFYLLAAIHPPSTVQLINSALHSNDPYTRANGAEAMETLMSPQTARLISILFDTQITAAQKLQLGIETWDSPTLGAGDALRLMLADPYDAWLRTVATFLLGEIGAACVSTTQAALNPAGQAAATESDTTRIGTSVLPADVAHAAGASFFTRAEIDEILRQQHEDPSEEVQIAARTAQHMLDSADPQRTAPPHSHPSLSVVERIIFLKEVPFFEGMHIEQLKVLAAVCEEEYFKADTRIFNEGDPGGTLYVVIRGRVGIEQERRAGSFARLSNVAARSYFGEASLFDNSPRSASAITLQDTLTLRLRREPLIALARQNPDLSLQLINVLSVRLRETNDRIADLTRVQPRKLQQLFDQFEPS